MVADPRQARRYVLIMGCFVLVLLASIPAMNVIVDPLGYARAAGWRPSNPTATEAALAAGGAWPVPHGTREAKMLNVGHYAPQSVLFGSSTVWSYVDAGYLPLRAGDGRSAFNFGLPGISARELLGAFEHVVALNPPKRIVIGLEFYMFSADKLNSPGFFDLPMAQRSSYRFDFAQFIGRRLLTADHTYAALALLWEPLVKRMASLWAEQTKTLSWFPFAGPNYGIGVGGGDRPAAAPAPVAPAARTARADFLKMMLDGDRVIIAGIYPAPGQPFRFVDDAGWSSLDAIRRMISLARAHDIDLRFYLSPSHARSYEAIRLMGWWPEFEAWQRELAAMVEEDARAHPDRPRIPLWDFGGFNSVTTDTVVDLPPNPAGFARYADSIHFKTDVGYMFMDRMFGTAGAQAIPPDFGVLLGGDTVEGHLARMREAQRAYASENAADIADVAAVLESLGRLKPLAP